MGLVSEGTQTGDLIAVLVGGQVLYVLHSSGAGEGRFRLVGEAYLHGVMDGEVTKILDSGECAIETIVFV
jgi:hypothetical protein